MSKARRQWTTPQLIVLARGMPEESVLDACKTNVPGSLGADKADLNGCCKENNCGACTGRVNT